MTRRVGVCYGYPIRRRLDALERRWNRKEEQRRGSEELRQYIRQVFARMEQSDARIEGMTRDIRRILDALERRGGDGGPGEP